MPVETASLWPVDFGEPVLLTPLAILRQQGAALGDQTKNIVVGRVVTRSGDNDGFMQIFSLYCAPLGYQTDPLVVKHGIDLYPATVFMIGEDASQSAADPSQLQTILKDMFARPRTKQKIASLLARSRQ
jgi:hypothetical protein